MPSYAWSCPACKASCAPASEVCFQCGCPANSTVAQQHAFRAAHAGSGPPARLPLFEAEVEVSVAAQLRSLRAAVLLRVFGGALASLLLAWLLHQFWAWSESKAGVAVVGFVSVALVFWPCARYLAKAQCPRCMSPWLSQSHSQEREGWFALWAFAHWRSCAHCGVSVNAPERVR
jgi:hypothetical protein